MDESLAINLVRQEIVNQNMLVKAVIQDIRICPGPLELLNELNSEGRGKIAALRKQIEKLETISKEQDKKIDRLELLKEVSSHRDQFTSTIAEFRKANMACLLTIEKSEKDDLFDEDKETSMLRNRQRKDKEGLVKMSSNVSEQLMSISRHLADTNQRSADTLETLANSSTTVHGTKEELLTTGSTISQSGKLLAKYGRREFTDKVLLFFAFAFFLAVVFYIVSKRLF